MSSDNAVALLAGRSRGDVRRTAVEVLCTVRSGLLRRNPCLLEHIHAVIFRRGFDADDLFLAAVEAVPHVAPVTAGAGFAVFGGAGFEEVGVFYAVQERREPG